MSQEAAATGPRAMVLVAIEQDFPEDERMLTDALSGPILPLDARFWVRVTRSLKGFIVHARKA